MVATQRDGGVKNVRDDSNYRSHTPTSSVCSTAQCRSRFSIPSRQLLILVTCLPGGREWVLPTTFETGTRSHQILKHYEGDTEHSVSLNLEAGAPEELIHPRKNTVNSSKKELNQQKKMQKAGVWSLTFNNIHKHIIEHPEQTFVTGTSSVEENQPIESAPTSKFRRWELPQYRSDALIRTLTFIHWLSFSARD